MIISNWKLFLILFLGINLSCSTETILFPQNSSDEVLGQLNRYWDLYEFHSGSNPDSALFFMEQARDLAEASGEEEWVAAAYGAIADVHIKQGFLEESIGNYLKAIKIFKKLGGLSQVANAYISVGVIYERQKDFQQAIDYNLKARDIFIYEGSNSDKAKVSRNLGIYYTELKAYEEAAEYLFQAEKYSLEGKDFHRLSLIYNSFGVLHAKKKDYQKAEEYYRLTLTYSDSLENGGWQKFMALHNIGESYFLEGNFSEAKKWLHHAILAKNDLGDPILSQNSYNLLAQIFILENKPADAVALLEESLQDIAPEAVDNSINESLALINQALLRMNEQAEPSELPYLNKMLSSYSEKFLAYNKKVSTLQEELVTISHQQAVQAAVERYAFNEQLKATEEAKEKMKYAFLIPIVLLIVALVAVYLTAKKNLHYKKLYSNIEQVLNSSKALRHLK